MWWFSRLTHVIRPLHPPAASVIMTGLANAPNRSMNPFLFKSHALLYATIAMLGGSGAYGMTDALRLAAIYLLGNVLTAWCFGAGARRSAGVRLRFRKVYLLSLPATLVYLPISVTLLNDVVHQMFALDDRYLLLFAVAVATVMLAGLYGVVIHHRGGQPIGSESGLALALILLLAMIPAGLLLLGLDGWLGFVPEVRPLE